MLYAYSYNYSTYRCQTSSGSSPSYSRSSDSKALVKWKAKANVITVKNWICSKETLTGQLSRALVCTVSADGWQCSLPHLADRGPGSRLPCFCPVAEAGYSLCSAPNPVLLLLPLWDKVLCGWKTQTHNEWYFWKFVSFVFSLLSDFSLCISNAFYYLIWVLGLGST